MPTASSTSQHRNLAWPHRFGTNRYAKSARWGLPLRGQRLGLCSDFFGLFFEILHHARGSALLLGIGFVRTRLMGMFGHKPCDTRNGCQANCDCDDRAEINGRGCPMRAQNQPPTNSVPNVGLEVAR